MAPGHALLERDAEIRVLQDRLARARDGEGGIVLVEAPAGAGKSALLGALRDEVADTARLRTALGSALERNFPFGLVRQLFEPVVRGASQDERARLLAGAAEVAAPIVGAGAAADGGSDDAFAVLHGLYWMTAALAEERPLVLVIDDAHWGDDASLQYADFLARRASELPLLLVVALRPSEPDAPQALLDSLASAPSSETLRLAPLSPVGARTLLDATLAAPADDAVAAAASEATGGNPLLVRELARTLAATDAVPTADDVRAARPSTVTRSVRQRLAALPERDAEVARALAVVGPARELLPTLTGLAAADVADALDGLAAAGLVAGERFTHPLIADAVAQTLPSARRDALHRAAADELRRRGERDEEVIGHVLAAEPFAAPWVVPALVDSARRASAEGAPGAAIPRLLRALELVRGEGGDADALLLALGHAESASGDPAYHRHLAEAARSDDPEVAGGALAIQVELGYGAGASGVEIAERIDAVIDDVRDPVLVARLRGARLVSLTLEVGGARRRSEALSRVTADDPPSVRGMLAYDLAARGATRERVLDVARGVLAEMPLAGAGLGTTADHYFALAAAMAVDAKDEVEAQLREAERGVGRRRSMLAAIVGDYVRTEWLLAFGSVALAADLADSLWRRGLEFDNPAMRITGDEVRVHALTLRGELAAADAALAESQPDDVVTGRFPTGNALASRAGLHHARGRNDAALADLDRVAALAGAFGWERFPRAPQGALRARVLAALGRDDEARASAEAELASARARRVPGAEADALGALALTQAGDEQLETLTGAVAVARTSGARIVLAGALLAFGGRMRRDGRRGDAREPLGEARDIAYHLGAKGLEARATDELVVAGARPRRIALSGVDALTPSERRVVEHAVAGLSNREIAETLFVTRKTVELHLSNAYGKLGIRSRTQLPEVLGT